MEAGAPPTTSADELVRQNVAPVKAAFLRSSLAEVAAERLAPPAEADAEAEPAAAGDAEPPPAAPPPPPFASGKLSKRAAARERHAARGTALCTAFTQGRCSWGDKCRFSHDLTAFKAAKAPDLPGPCPFEPTGGCPYGVACRFEGAHAFEGVGALGASSALAAERNAVSGDLLSLLRRNRVAFPAADARLRDLGLRVSFKSFQPEPLPAAAAPVGEAAVGAGDEEEAAADCGRGEGGGGKRARVERSTDAALLLPRAAEVKLIDFRGKSYLAPLTTVGNLPFRRLCKSLGADITCSEMALATNLLQGAASEWALLRRHPCEDIFGIQLCGGFPDALSRTCELLTSPEASVTCDFVDLNAGCPIDLVCDKGAGAALLNRAGKLEAICRACAPLLAARGVPLTLKTRTGWADAVEARLAHGLAPQLAGWGVAALTLHGRSRAQRYSRLADWDYIRSVGTACAASGLQLVGNGDVASYTEHEEALAGGHVTTTLVARGALVKPWVFTEIRERRHWDISATERLELMKTFAAHGLEHWGSDARGVESTRRFLLEWLSFAHRYIPVGLLDVLPQKLSWRAPAFVARSQLETLLASPAPSDWVAITTMLLGPTPKGFTFAPKHKAKNDSEGAAAFEQSNG